MKTNQTATIDHWQVTGPGEPAVRPAARGSLPATLGIGPKRVASAILADVEPRLPARRNRPGNEPTTVNFERCSLRMFLPGGRMPPSTAGKDACRHSFRPARGAFTLIEVLVAVTLLSLIVIALMAVFTSTQKAFRASVTQTDVLASGRAVIDLIAGDLRAMAPSMGASNYVTTTGVILNGTVNFYAGTNYYQTPPLIQPLVASSDSRANGLQDIFILSRDNLNGVPSWVGTGYAVRLSPTNTYSLYRFSTSRPVAQDLSAWSLFNVDFMNFRAVPNGTNSNYSHLLDGVVDFQVRAFDASGMLLITNRPNIRTNMLQVLPLLPNSIAFYSNALPGSVEIELATLEDRTLQRADSRPGAPPAPPNDSRTQYLETQASQVHVFRQRVAIPNVDPSIYQ